MPKFWEYEPEDLYREKQEQERIPPLPKPAPPIPSWAQSLLPHTQIPSFSPSSFGMGTEPEGVEVEPPTPPPPPVPTEPTQRRWWEPYAPAPEIPSWAKGLVNEAPPLSPLQSVLGQPAANLGRLVRVLGGDISPFSSQQLGQRDLDTARQVVRQGLGALANLRDEVLGSGAYMLEEMLYGDYRIPYGSRLNMIGKLPWGKNAERFRLQREANIAKGREIWNNVVMPAVDVLYDYGVRPGIGALFGVATGQKTPREGLEMAIMANPLIQLPATALGHVISEDPKLQQYLKAVQGVHEKVAEKGLAMREAQAPAMWSAGGGLLHAYGSLMAGLAKGLLALDKTFPAGELEEAGEGKTGVYRTRAQVEAFFAPAWDRYAEATRAAWEMEETAPGILRLLWGVLLDPMNWLGGAGAAGRLGAASKAISTADTVQNAAFMLNIASAEHPEEALAMAALQRAARYGITRLFRSLKQATWSGKAWNEMTPEEQVDVLARAEKIAVDIALSEQGARMPDAVAINRTTGQIERLTNEQVDELRARMANWQPIGEPGTALQRDVFGDWEIIKTGDYRNFIPSAARYLQRIQQETQSGALGETQRLLTPMEVEVWENVRTLLDVNINELPLRRAAQRIEQSLQEAKEEIAKRLAAHPEAEDAFWRNVEETVAQATPPRPGDYVVFRAADAAGGTTMDIARVRTITPEGMLVVDDVYGQPRSLWPEQTLYHSSSEEAAQRLIQQMRQDEEEAVPPAAEAVPEASAETPPAPSRPERDRERGFFRLDPFLPRWIAREADTGRSDVGGGAEEHPRSDVSGDAEERPLSETDPEAWLVRQELEKGRLPLTLQRAKPEGVGKRIGDSLYVHRSAEDVIPRIQEAKARLPEGFTYDVVKYDAPTGAVSFFRVPDFDTSPEPAQGEGYRVNANGEVEYRPARKENPFLYHHKWLMVREDYPGFDQEAAKLRSRGIEIYDAIHRGLREHYTMSSAWHRWVEPWLEKYGFTSATPERPSAPSPVEAESAAPAPAERPSAPPSLKAEGAGPAPYTIVPKSQLDGIEIAFAAAPDREITSWLKENGFRYSSKNRVWYRRPSSEWDRADTVQRVAAFLAEQFPNAATRTQALPVAPSPRAINVVENDLLEVNRQISNLSKEIMREGDYLRQREIHDQIAELSIKKQNLEDELKAALRQAEAQKEAPAPERPLEEEEPTYAERSTTQPDAVAGGASRPDQRALEEAPEGTVQRASGPGRGSAEGGVAHHGAAGPGLRHVPEGVGHGRDSSVEPGDERGRLPEVLAPQEPSQTPSRQEPPKTLSRSGGSVLPDYVITPEDQIGQGGPKERFWNNIKAIELLRKLEQEGRLATPEEQKILVRYLGWGDSRFNLAFGNQYSVDYYDRSEADRRGWSKEYEALRRVLTKEQYDAAARSRLTAFYTSPEIINAMWHGLQRMGLEEWNAIHVLEPSAGVGHFYGLMPTSLAARSSRVAVELDETTAAILRNLYQGTAVHHEGFETVPLPLQSFDLIITNVPFGDYSITVPQWERSVGTRWLNRLKIHNQFLALGLEYLRPGGVMAVITRHDTLDARGAKRLRTYLAERADLLGAFRLPRNAFERMAGTDVVTDILFLRKRLPGEKPQDLTWTESRAAEVTPDGSLRLLSDSEKKKLEENARRYWGDELFHINAYYLEHPERILGENSNTRRYGSAYTVLPYPGQSLEGLLREAIQMLPEKVLTPPVEEAPLQRSIGPLAPAEVDVRTKAGAYILGDDDHTVYIVDRKTGKTVPAKFRNKGEEERVRGQLRIAKAVKDLYRMQMEGESPEAVATAMAKLNRLYDEFTSVYGPLNHRTNKRLMRFDPSAPLLLSLENWNEDIEKALRDVTVSADGTKKYRPKTRLTDADRALLKTDVFYKPTLRPIEKETKADSPRDALMISLNETAKVDLVRIAELLGVSQEEARNALRGLVYDDPMGGLVSADEYLSGNVREKLAQAEQAARRDPRYQENVEALRKVQPKDLTPSEIEVSLGAGWVPTEVMQDFFYHITGAKDPDLKIRYFPALGLWSVPTVSWKGNHILLQSTWGTPYMHSDVLFEKIVNKRPIQVRRKNHVTGEMEIDTAQTQMAQEKARQMEEEFRRWIWEDSKRAAEITRIYNQLFNSYVAREYDGSHLTLPGSNPNITLYPHQKAAIWRGLVAGNTLLAHEVGAGKTFEMIAIGMERRRLGLSHKNLYVVPNGLVEQWTREFLKLYPSATILVPPPDAFNKENRALTFARIQSGDWDAIILPQSQFTALAPHPETVMRVIQEQIDEYEESLLLASGESGDRKTQKEIQQAIARLEAQLRQQKERLANRQDDIIFWDELGIDCLFVDEADMYKNLPFATRMGRIKGLSAGTKAQRASDMYVKVREISERTNNRGVIFATGTPVSNSIAELWTMMRYLNRPLLVRLGMTSFDAWAATFGKTAIGLELDAKNNYRLVTRFSQWQNAPELSRLWQETADIVLSEDVPELKSRLPRLDGGKRRMVVVPATQALRDFTKSLESRIEWVREHAGDQEAMREDNYLKIYSDARKAAIDLRLVSSKATEEDSLKLKAVAEHIAYHWKEDAADRGTQIVFLDLGTPKAMEDEGPPKASSEEEEGEVAPETETKEEIQITRSLYEILKRDLLAHGIPEDEIAFIHDAKTPQQRKELFDAVNAGRIRILIGSTAKMGAGVNVQKRLHVLHHIDVPWRPRDIEQREGRILRQGNEIYGPRLDEKGRVIDPGRGVIIYQYITEESFDAYSWQTVEAKWHAIKAMMRKHVTARTMAEMDEDELDAATFRAAASGDMLAFEHVKLKNEIAQLEMLKGAWLDQQVRAREIIDRAEEHIEALKAKRERAERAIERIAQAGEAFSATIGERVFKDRAAASKALIDKVEQLWDELTARSPLGRDYVVPWDGPWPYLERPLGEFKGFPLFFRLVRHQGVASLVIKIENDIHETTSFDRPEHTPAAGSGLFTRVENLLRSLQDAPSRIQEQIERAQEEAATWRDILDKPFEKEGLLRRRIIEFQRISEALEKGQKTMPDFSDLDALEASGELPPSTPTNIVVERTLSIPEPETAEAPAPEMVEAPEPEMVETPAPERVEAPAPEAPQGEAMPAPERMEAPAPDKVETPTLGWEEPPAPAQGEATAEGEEQPPSLWDQTPTAPTQDPAARMAEVMERFAQGIERLLDRIEGHRADLVDADLRLNQAMREQLAEKREMLTSAERRLEAAKERAVQAAMARQEEEAAMARQAEEEAAMARQEEEASAPDWSDEEPSPDPSLTYAYGPDPNVRYIFRFRVVDLDDLIASHTLGMTPNPDYPQELQPRLRDRAASRLQIEHIAQELNPDALLDDVHQLDRGPVIIGPDLVVESGNGRVLALRLAREQNGPRWKAYQDTLRKVIARYGISPQDLVGLEAPVLVRERISEVDRVEFAAEANQSATMSMSAYEDALQDARRIEDEDVMDLVIAPDLNLKDTLLMPANREFLRRFIASLPANERPTAVDKGGMINQQGLNRLEAALFAKTYRGEAGRTLAGVFFESVDTNIALIKQGILNSLPIMAKAESLMRQGLRDPSLSLADDLARTVEVFAQLRSADIPVKNYLAQQTMWERELTPFQERLLVHLAEISRAPRKVREFIERYAQGVIDAPVYRQANMFGEKTITKEEVFENAANPEQPEAAEQEAPSAPAETVSPRLETGEVKATPEPQAGTPEATPEPQAGAAKTRKKAAKSKAEAPESLLEPPAPRVPEEEAAETPPPATEEQKAMVQAEDGTPLPPPDPEKHWSEDDAQRRAFWRAVKRLGLSVEDVYRHLGIENLRAFNGTMREAIDILEETVAALEKSKPPAEPEAVQEAPTEETSEAPQEEAPSAKVPVGKVSVNPRDVEDLMRQGMSRREAIDELRRRGQSTFTPGGERARGQQAEPPAERASGGGGGERKPPSGRQRPLFEGGEGGRKPPRGRQGPLFEEEGEGPLPYGENLRRVRASREPEAPLTPAERVRRTIQRARTDWIDRFAPLHDLEKITGVPVGTYAELVAGAVGRAESLIMQHADPVLEKVADQIEDFLDLMEILRMRSIRERWPEAKLPGKVDDPEQALKEWQEKVGERAEALLEAAEAFARVNEKLFVDEAVRYGLWSQEVAERVKATNPYYIPFYRQGFEDEMEHVATRAAAHAPDVVSHLLKKEGSWRKLQDPLAAWYTGIVRLQVLGARNRAAQALHKALKTINPSLVREGGTDEPGWENIEYRYKGEKITVGVPEEFGRAARGMDAHTLGVVERVFREINRPLKAGAVKYNPDFLLRNVLRDAAMAWFTEGVVPFSSYWWEGMIAAFTKNETWHRAAQLGGFTGSLIDEANYRSRIERMARQKSPGAIKAKNMVDALRKIIEIVPTLSENLEQGTRLAAFRKLEREGIVGPELARRMANSTVNFDRAGNVMRVVNNIIPFSNARLQGMDRIIRAFRENPKQSFLRMIPFMVVALLAYLNNKRFKTSDKIPAYEYRRNWVFQIGEGTMNPDPRRPHLEPETYPIYIKVPMGEVAMLPAALTRAILDIAWENHDGTVMQRILEGLYEGVADASPIELGASAFLTPFFGTYVQMAINKDVFRGREIVPTYEQHRPPEEQFGPETSKTAVALGKAFGISPRYIEFAVQDTLAGGGKTALWLSDLVLGAIGLDYHAPGQALRREDTSLQRLVKTPIVRSALGAYGNEEQRREAMALAKAVDDSNRMLMQNKAIRDLDVHVAVPDRYWMINGREVEITYAQRRWYVRQTAQRLDAVAEALQKDPWFTALAPDERLRVLQHVKAKIQTDLRRQIEGLITGEGHLGWSSAQMPALARAVRQWYEFQEIPAYVGLSDEEIEAALSAQDAYAALRAQKKVTNWAEYLLVTGDDRGYRLGKNLDRYRNPARLEYWNAHPELQTFYPDAKPAAPASTNPLSGVLPSLPRIPLPSLP